MTQIINGNNNNQIQFNNDPGFDPDNPNIVDCPSCWKPTSRFAEPCPRCGYNVKAHFEWEQAMAQRAREEARLRSLAKIQGTAVVLGLGCMFTVSWLSKKGYITGEQMLGVFVAGVVLVFIAANLGKK
ncbi:hypothetical protein [Bowmanella dokdonensis]|uniref:Uncharacterized protein n=1 Tax=Bowmanella dokdonensis TaxID=751969 RepID=A0A939DLI1_9ALTE|nr:hypothetical protein [Bowmanella dokdonensis]MBN7824765.1 hypothetical protein [Bowmanella dokdonensis]